MDDIRFPIGLFEPYHFLTDQDRKLFIEQLPAITQTIRKLLKSLEPEQLEVPYRQGGWTIKQIVHHLADNDMNAYIRFKRALTEDVPQAGTYREDLWADLSDYRNIPIDNSILLLEVLHARFKILLDNLNPEDFKKTLITQALGIMTLDTALQRLLWHNRHHISQIEYLMSSRGWQSQQ